MKKIVRMLLCLALVAAVGFPVIAMAVGGSFHVSAPDTVAPGETFEVSLSGNSVGRVDLQVTNGTLSETKIWFEKTGSFKVTAGQSGEVTIVITPAAGFSDLDAEIYDPGVKTVKVQIVMPTEPPVTEPPATEPPTTEPPATEPPATESPTTEPPATEPPATEPHATEPPATEPPATEPPATESPATEPPATEPPATEPPATEPPTTEPPVTEPEESCFLHWVILVVAAVATALTVMKSTEKAHLVTLLVYGILAGMLVVLGGCDLDMICYLVGMAVTGAYPLYAQFFVE